MAKRRVMAPLADAWLGLTSEAIRTVGSAATAVGVLIALFGGAWARWWRDPLLRLEHEPHVSDPHWDIVCVADESLFVRARVRNARGCVAAKDAEVIVTEFRAGQLGLTGRTLEWSGRRARSEPPVTRIDIPPGLTRHVDLVQVTPKDDAFDARLCVHPRPWGEAETIQGTNEVKLRVVLAAANADPVAYEMWVRHRGGLDAELSRQPKLVDATLRYRLRSWFKRS